MVLAAKVVGEVVEKYVEKEPVKSVANVKKRRRLLTDSDEKIVGRKVKKAKRSQVWTCTFCDTAGCDKCHDRCLLSATLETHICTKSCVNCGGVLETEANSTEHKCLVKQRSRKEDGCSNCGSFRCDGCGKMFAFTVSFNHHICLPCKKPPQSLASPLYHAPCSATSIIPGRVLEQDELDHLKALKISKQNGEKYVQREFINKFGTINRKIREKKVLTQEQQDLKNEKDAHIANKKVLALATLKYKSRFYRKKNKDSDKVKAQQFNCLLNDHVELKAKHDFKSAEYKLIAEDKDLINVSEAIELKRKMEELKVKNATMNKFVEQLAQTMYVVENNEAKLTDETTTEAVDILCLKVQTYLNGPKAKTDVVMPKADLETFTSRVANGNFNLVQTDHSNLEKLQKKVNADAAAVALNSSSQTIPKVFDIFGKKTGRKGTYGCDFCQEKLKFKKDLPKHLLDVHQITKDSHSKYLRFDGACWTPILPQQLNITE